MSNETKQVTPFTPGEAKILGGFETTVQTYNKAERMVQNGQSVPVVEVSKTGEKTKKTLDETIVYEMKSVAFDTYADHLRHNPDLKQAAQDIVTREKQQAAEKQQALPDVKALETIWELPAYVAHEKDPDDEERAIR